jgi:hypothetical protein
MNRPAEGTYNPYFGTYISKVEGDNILDILKNQLHELEDFFKKIPSEKWSYSYGEGKWTLAESWIHVNDTERIFAYRALRISRGDQTPLPGFDQDDYVPFYNAKNRTPQSIFEEFISIRKASLSLLESIDANTWDRTGTASNHKISVRAIAFILAGHAEHHLRITKEKYLAS